MNFLKLFLKYILKTLQVDILVERAVEYGMRRSMQRNPFIFEEFKNSYEDAFKKTYLTKFHNVGEGVRINGQIKVTHFRGVVLGNNVHIGGGCYFHSRGGLTIGDNSHLSRNITIYTASHNYIGHCLPYDSSSIDKPVIIGKNVWIGMNVNITPGVTIGDGAIIGMGVTVAKDVKPLEIVGQQPFRSLKFRDQMHYESLIEQGHVGGKNGEYVKVEEQYAYGQTASEKGANMFFVVGTGRCGSTTIAKALTIDGELTCLHEPKLQLVRTSTKYAHGELPELDVKSELQQLFDGPSALPQGVYGESDQKLSNMIAILHQLFPAAKFLWLIRNPVDTVNSMHSRGWFSDNELFRSPGKEPNTDRRYRPVFGENRIHADKAGAMSHAQWVEMSEFERNCWYWTYWNELIENQLNVLPAASWMKVKLEELSDVQKDVISFVGADASKCKQVEKTNAARNYSLSSVEDWDSAMRTSFNLICGSQMKAWYPEMKAIDPLKES